MRLGRGFAIVASALLFVPAGPAWAQQTAEAQQAAETLGRPGLRVGLKAGASLSRLRGAVTLGSLTARAFNADWGFDAGVTIEIPVSDRFSIQPEWHVLRKVTKLDLGGGRDGLRSKLSVNYVQIPLLAKIYPGDRTGLSSNIVFGPAASVRLQASREARLAGSITDIPVDDEVRSLDWSLLFGFGFEFQELFGALTLDLRYNHGLTSVDPSRQLDAKWRALYLLIGVTF